ncbi:hypothetical protein QAD02_019135 [Eretmocerus hayati]|uniref:Uncharacterized protein n=1 Tax=Eretmocerus hayati TaxID=131215 RepID=A0ACC2PJZ8_9HYME|nr:hypothetical protein QAD02_019135 [Eretmocerus hayati]
MSYGYQGPPYPNNRPPTSFGAPPGTPSVAPSAPPYSKPPTSFGMPQPYSPYPAAPYPNMGGPPPQPASQPNNPYPSPNYPPQPGYGSPSYPPQPHQPYPSPGQPPQSYPPQPSQPYSSGPGYPTQQPYPSNPMSQPSSQPATHPYNPSSGYPSSAHNPSFPTNQSHARSGSGLYPDLSRLDNPNPSIPSQMHGSGSTPYPGGGYSGGPSGGGNFSYGGSAPHNTPRMTQAPAKPSPTVGLHQNFNPVSDAEILRKAMKGFGTDEKAIIQVLAHRSNEQRQEIAKAFKTSYGKDLIKDLKSETSGNFEKLLVAMMTPLPQYIAKELHDAISGIGTDETVLIEVMCTMSNHEINVIKQAYEAMYGKSLEDELMSDTSGNFKRLMVSLCQAGRDESFHVDRNAAAHDARQLLQAGELRFGTDESTFNAILCQRNVAQLREIFAEYQNITGHDIEQAIKNEFSGDVEKGLLAIVKCVKNRPGFFAEQIYKSMKGAGTDDQRLIRLIVTRSEMDMGEIKQAFMQQYGQSLENRISDDCSGDYKKCLIALIS